MLRAGNSPFDLFSPVSSPWRGIMCVLTFEWQQLSLVSCTILLCNPQYCHLCTLHTWVSSGGECWVVNVSSCIPILCDVYRSALVQILFIYGGRRQMHFSIDSPHLRPESELKTILLWSTWECLFCSTLPIWFTPAVSFPRYLSSHWIGTSWQARFFQTTASSLWALTWLSHASPFSLNLQNNPVDDESDAQSGQLVGAHETVDTDDLSSSLLVLMNCCLCSLSGPWPAWEPRLGPEVKSWSASAAPTWGNSSAAHRSFNSCA